MKTIAGLSFDTMFVIFINILVLWGVSRCAIGNKKRIRRLSVLIERNIDEIDVLKRRIL